MYYWVLKYVLYTVFSKRALASAYFEGGVLGALLVMPFITLSILFNVFDANKLILLAPRILMFDVYMTWDSEYTFRKYSEIRQNRGALESKFKAVKAFMVTDLVAFVIALAYITIKRQNGQ